MEMYTPKYFKESLPDWKKKMDSVLVRYVHRPLSFFAASAFCKLHMSANEVSVVSLVVGLLASGIYLIDSRAAYIAGAILLNIWMVLDCTDGNIARSVKKEKFGEFVDASSGYFLMSTLFICMGIAGWRCDGVFFAAGNIYIMFAGALASSSDSLGRLIYQKYLNQAAEQEEQGEEQADKSSVSRLRKVEDRIDKEVGLNGLFLPFAVIVSCMEWFDVFILFYATYNLLRLAGTFILLVHKVFKANRAVEA